MWILLTLSVSWSEISLEKSIYNQQLPPSAFVDGIEMPYDPFVVSIVSSLRSREPKRKASEWESKPLPPLSPDTACALPLEAHVHKSKTGSRYWFVILPGAYATWKRGSFTNQTSSILKEHFQDPNILALAGYLSPEFLEEKCQHLPWNALSFGVDIYSRLRMFLKAQGADPARTGILGFSGGGTLATRILAEDGIASTQIFELGGMAFSPILDARVTFRNLDTRFRKSPIPQAHGLTTMDVCNVVFLVKNFGPPTWQQIPSLREKNPEEFEARAFNEFTNVDLVDSLKSVGFEFSRFPESQLNYHGVYVEKYFRGSASINHYELDRVFDQAMDLRPYLKQIRRPLFIYFSQDDPVLSDPDGTTGNNH